MAVGGMRCSPLNGKCSSYLKAGKEMKKCFVLGYAKEDTPKRVFQTDLVQQRTKKLLLNEQTEFISDSRSVVHCMYISAFHSISI